MGGLSRWLRLAHTELTMPALSPTMKSGGIVAWKKAVGDSIAPGEVVAEIETDKATVDFESQEEGFLAKVFVHDGASDVKVGTVVGIMVDEEEELSGPFPVPEPENQTTRQSPEQMPEIQYSKCDASKTSSPGKYNGPTGPAVNRLVAQYNVDLSSVTPTGRHGRILKGDVLAFLEASTQPQKEMADGEKKAASPPKATPKSEQVQALVPSKPAARYTDRPVTMMRKVIAARLLESKTTVPHFYSTASFDLDELLSLRKSVNREQGSRISVNDFVIRAAALALEKVPIANSTWDTNSQSVLINADIDISFAVAVENGLFTPIIKSANMKSVAEVSSEAKNLVKRAREGKLMPEDYQGGTFSISNLGMFGISKFQAIINPPQACNLAVGAGIDRVMARDWQFERRTVATGTLSSDARVLNEQDAANFLTEFAAGISNPESLL